MLSYVREGTMKRPLGALLFAASFLICGPGLGQTTLTIATVNNGDMIRMQGLTGVFTAKYPDINVKWVTLEENVLRQRVTTDIATKGGQFDETRSASTANSMPRRSMAKAP
jgi:sorbitol/mannitol transport system substrate-binding protein